MGKKTIWEKALFFSLILHLVLVPYLSWLAGNSLAAVPKRQEIIELTMVTLPPESKPLVEPPIQERKVDSPKHIVEKQVVEKTTTSQPRVVRTEKTINKKMINNTPVTKNQGEVADRIAVPLASSTGKEKGEASNSNASINNNNSNSSNESSSVLSSSPRQVSYLPPQLLKKVEPSYPDQAREKGIQGTVVVRVEILEDGRVGEVALKNSSGQDLLDQAALKAAKKWRFVPAKDRDTGQPVKCFTSFPVVFRLT